MAKVRKQILKRTEDIHQGKRYRQRVQHDQLPSLHTIQDEKPLNINDAVLHIYCGFLSQQQRHMHCEPIRHSH